jgi:hypothetical protein
MLNTCPVCEKENPATEVILVPFNVAVLTVAVPVPLANVSVMLET